MPHRGVMIEGEKLKNCSPENTTLVGWTKFPVASVTATGSTVTDAAALSFGLNVVSGADATTGVVLPAVTGGCVVFVKNTANAVLKVWPPSTATINAIGSNSSISLAAYTSAIFIASSATQWYTIPLLPS